MTATHAPQFDAASPDNAPAPDAGIWIIHGVARASAPAPRDAPEHRRVAAGDLVALVSPCRLGAPRSDPQSDPQGDPQGARLSDPDSNPKAAPALEAAEAVRHNAVLAAYAEIGDVAPARFGALCAGPDAAAALVGADAARHGAILDRLAGCVEMGVRILAAPKEAQEPEHHVPANGGAGYLRGVAAARDARRRAAAERSQAVASLIDALGDGARERAAFAPKPAPGGAQRLAEVALLTPRTLAASLRARAEALAGRANASGLVIEITGPWPAYSFAAPKPAPESAPLQSRMHGAEAPR